MLLWMCEICWCWKGGTKSQLQLYFPCMCAICKATQLYGNPGTRLSQMSSSNNPDVYTLTRVSPVAPKLMHPFIISPTKFKSVTTVWSLSFMVAALQFSPRLQPLGSADRGLEKEQLLPCKTEADCALSLWNDYPSPVTFTEPFESFLNILVPILTTTEAEITQDSMACLCVSLIHYLPMLGWIFDYQGVFRLVWKNTSTIVRWENRCHSRSVQLMLP